MVSIEIVILVVSILLLLSILASKISDRFGIPALLLFLVVGMLAGSEGVGGIHFNDAWLATFIGSIALIFILFSGGIETKWSDVRSVVWQGAILSTVGVCVTAVIVAVGAMYILDFSFLQGMLLGAIISSTDAASVFQILRSKNIHLKGRLRALLELESGSNDPMAVFLTLGMIRLLSQENFTFMKLIPQFFLEVTVALAMAFIMSRLFLFIINHSKLGSGGLYPVLTLAFVPLIYAMTTLLKGNGFLAVYAAALILGNREFLHKKTLIHFHEGISWLMQIFMFLILGLLVYPSRMVPIMGAGLLLSVFLILVARPIAVFLGLSFSRFKTNEKLMVAWVGLRGAVPIVLATFPLLAGLPSSDLIFNIVFFTVLTSIFIQGTSIPLVSRLLKVNGPSHRPQVFPIGFEQHEGIDANLVEIVVPYDSGAARRRLFEIGIPEGCLVVLLCRNERFTIPNGATVIQEGDVLQILGKPSAIRQLERKLHISAGS